MGKATEYTRVAVDKLIPYVNNAKQHSDSQVTKIASSIREFGFLNPVLIDADYNVIAGHGRILAAKKLGLDEVPCLFVEGLSDAQRKAYILADNRLAEMAEWDMDLVQGELEELADLDFDIDLTGFDFQVEPEITDDEDDIPEPPTEPKAKLGDLYQLGRHRLICGDSTDVNVIDRLMDGVKADMVFTDPPYGVDYKGINNDSRDGLSDLLNGAFATAMANTKQGGAVYCFHSDKCADIFQECFRKFCHFSSTIIWKKKSLVLSQTDYQSIHEPCLYGWFNNGTHNFYGDRKQTSVWEFDRENIDGHTTPKPIGFIAKALQNSSREGEIVLDVFGGSGSTLIACEQLNRKCYMCELDPKYVDVIVERWENFTGKKAVLLDE